jgi:SAM-dependent methyltransferase
MEAGLRVEGLLLDRCPYCDAPLAEVRSGPFGILRCGCSEHPVIDGIVCLADDRSPASGRGCWDRVLARIRAEDGPGALAAALAPNLRTRCGRTLAILTRSGRSSPPRIRARAEQDVRRLVLDTDLTFREAIRLLRNESYGEYLFHRYSNPSMVAAAGLIALLKNVNVEGPRVLDIGGGAGHASWLISLVRPDARVTLADQDFTNLYLAKRFVSRNAGCVCLDAEALLPFEDGAFDVVFSLDSFHYVRGKAALARELERVAAPGAVMIFSHLHNALGSNPAPGLPLSPEDYSRLLPLCTLFREDRIIESVAREGAVDLGPEAEEADMQGASALCAVGGPEWLWAKHDVSAAYSGATHVLNPLYARREGAFVPQWPSRPLAIECAAMDRIMPTRLDDSALDAAGREPESLAARELRDRRGVLPLPERYA